MRLYLFGSFVFFPAPFLGVLFAPDMETDIDNARVVCGSIDRMFYIWIRLALFLVREMGWLGYCGTGANFGFVAPNRTGEFLIIFVSVL